MAARVSGTEGYAEVAEALLNQTLSFTDVHRPVLHLMPNAPCRVLDIGSGAGHDAASFAEQPVDHSPAQRPGAATDDGEVLISHERLI